MKEHDYNFYSQLRNKSVSVNAVPKSVRNSLHYRNLFSSKTLDTEKSGRGSKIIIKDVQSFDAFFFKYFSDEEVTTITKSSSVKKFRDSKARKGKSSPIFFIRGFKEIKLNQCSWDLEKYTNSFGLFSAKEPLIETDNICFVENLESFLNAEKLFGDSFIYLHKYGRIGTESLKRIIAKEILVFVDYDFNGLDEYLRIKSVYENATLFIPENFAELFQDYSKSIRGKQKQSSRVAQSELKEVVKIREMVSRTNRFLEQEILTHD